MLWFVGRLQVGQSMILKRKNNSVGIAQLVMDFFIYIKKSILLMSEMERGSSMIAAEVRYLLSLRELCNWILGFDENAYPMELF